MIYDLPSEPRRRLEHVDRALEGTVAGYLFERCPRPRSASLARSDVWAARSSTISLLCRSSIKRKRESGAREVERAGENQVTGKREDPGQGLAEDCRRRWIGF